MTTLSPAILKRAKEEVSGYLENKLRYCYTDCSDSMHEARSYEDRFDAVVGDNVSIVTFITEHCLPDYVAAWKVACADVGAEGEDAKWPGVCGLPIPYDTFKHLL